MGNSGPNGFNGSTTAEQAAGDADLTGKWALVTGCSAGIGVETVRVLLLHNCNVVMACRDKEKMGKAAASILESVQQQSQGKNTAKLEQMILNLASLKQIATFVAEFKQKNLPINLLVLNAGVMMPPLGHTEDGFETQMGTNHFGHFALTMGLMDVLKQSQPARVIAVSSIGHNFADLNNFEDLDWKKRSYGTGIAAYGNSKMANILFAKALDKKCKETSGLNQITAVSLHPGSIDTELGRHSTLSSVFYKVGFLFNKSVQQGAATTVYCCVAKDVENQGGSYYDNCNVAQPNGARDEDAAKLWEISEKLTSVKWPY